MTETTRFLKSRFIPARRPAYPEDRSSWSADIAEPPQASHVRIWIDLENTPHIPFFLPIIRELRGLGHEVMLTARDAYQTCEMAGFHALPCQRIGRHYGRRVIAKAWGLLVRGLQLARFVRRLRPDLALNLGSRSQNLAAKLLGIPVVEIMDYEHTAESALLEPRWYLTPDVVRPALRTGMAGDRILTYHGLKEDVYVPDFIPDPAILDQLGLSDARTVVTIRPAATEAHYHNPEAEPLFERMMERVMETPGVKAVLLPRNKRQELDLRERHPAWFEGSKVVIPAQVVDGLNLIWHSDLVVSGGGTMNREAAALGVPVYSIFRGRIGAVDRNLCEETRLVLIETTGDVDRKIRIEPRPFHRLPDPQASGARSDILGHLRSIIASLQPHPAGSTA